MSNGVFLPTDDYQQLVAERTALWDELASAHTSAQSIEEVGRGVSNLSASNLPSVPLLVSSDNPSVQLQATLQGLTSEMERIQQHEAALQQAEEALQKAKSQQTTYIIVGVLVGLLLLAWFMIQAL